MCFVSSMKAWKALKTCFEQSTLWRYLTKQSSLPVPKRTNKIASFYTTPLSSWSTPLARKVSLCALCVDCIVFPSSGHATGGLKNDMKQLMRWLLCSLLLSELCQIASVVLIILQYMGKVPPPRGVYVIKRVGTLSSWTQLPSWPLVPFLGRAMLPPRSGVRPMIFLQ